MDGCYEALWVLWSVMRSCEALHSVAEDCVLLRGVVESYGVL